jgi:predicted permease
MARTFRNLRSVRPGFEAAGVLTMDVALPEQRYGREAAVASGFYDRLADRLRALPDVRHVGFTDRMPLASGDWCTGITLEGPTPEAATGACPPSTLVSPGYFEAMGIRVEGRTLEWSGMRAHDGAVVVSRAFADHRWPNESPIGKGMKFNGTRPPFYRVVGVAEDVRGLGVDAPPPEYVYFPILPIPDAPLWGSPTYMHLVLKTSLGNPLSLTSTITRIVQETEPQAAVANVHTMETLLARSIAKQSFTMVLLLISATIAMLLSAVGIYGVISYIVTQRRGEIGVRLALGARAPQVTSMVLRQSLAPALIGVGLGTLAAWGTTRTLSALLFGVQPTDPLTLVVVPLALLAVAALASYAPARRASHIDPAEALRTD